MSDKKSKTSKNKDKSDKKNSQNDNVIYLDDRTVVNIDKSKSKKKPKKD